MSSRWLLRVCVIALTLAPSVVLAVSLPGKIVPCDGPQCSVCDLATLAQNVLNIGIFVAVFLSAILFAWGGWMYLTAGGGGEISHAKDVLKNVTLGLVVILASWLIVDTLMRTLTKIPAWNTLCGV